jgi:chromosome segregation ATPase
MVKPGASELAAVMDDPSSSPDAKLAAVSKLFLDKASAMHKCAKKLEDAEAQRGVALVQRDATRRDMEKVIAVKEKLEVLCRELQRVNKAVVADAKAASVAEAEKRAQLSEKFESGLGDITTKLNAQADDRANGAKENEELREHLRKLIERGDLQEAHLRKAKETWDLEKQLLQAQFTEAGERRKAQEALCEALEKQLSVRGEREAALTEQLAGYAEKFNEFQTVIARSNETFALFKKESSDREKAVKLAEGRTAELEAKANKSDVALIGLLQEKERLMKNVSSLTTQKEKLEALCRALRDGSRTSAENTPPASSGTAAAKKEVNA